MNTTIKAIALVAVIAMVAVALVGEDSDAEQFTDGGIVYSTSGNNATVIGWEGASSEITIPSEVTHDNRTYRVTTIGSEAFMGSDLTSVTIPDSVTRVEARAFYGLSIATLDLPDSITYLGADAFSDNPVITEVTLPASLSSYYHAFSNCASLTAIQASGDFTSVSGVLFSDDDVLKQYPAGKEGQRYTIPTDTKSIDDYVFRGSQVESVTIPRNVADIGAGAFSLCDSLTTFTLSNNNHFRVSGTMLLGDNARTVLAYAAGSNGTSVEIPANVNTIAASVFEGSSIQSVTMPTSMRTIGSDAFADCVSLTSVSMNSGITDVGSWVFSGCTALEEVTIPTSLEELGSSMFMGCTSLTSVAWGNTGSSEIGASAFEGCTSLSSVAIPSRTSDIGERAFHGCVALTGVTIPDSVTTIGDGAFAESGLTEVVVPYVRNMGAGVFESCTALTAVTLEQDVDEIPERTFNGCSDLSTIRFADGGDLETIGANAFSMTAITSISLPEGVTQIDGTAFEDCAELETVSLPASLRNVGDMSFDGCTSLRSFAVSDDSTSYAAVDGILYSKDLATLVRFPEASERTEFTIPEDTVTISPGAFASSENLTYVHIPATVNTIGDGAFMGCSGLTSIQIASERLTVGDGAFDLAAGGEPVDVEIFTDAEAFPETAFGTGTNPIYDAYDNYGIPETDEVMQGALIWIVIAIVLGVVFLAVHVRGKRA